MDEGRGAERGTRAAPRRFSLCRAWAGAGAHLARGGPPPGTKGWAWAEAACRFDPLATVISVAARGAPLTPPGTKGAAAAAGTPPIRAPAGLALPPPPGTKGTAPWARVAGSPPPGGCCAGMVGGGCPGGGGGAPPPAPCGTKGAAPLCHCMAAVRPGQRAQQVAARLPLFGRCINEPNGLVSRFFSIRSSSVEGLTTQRSPS